MRNQSTAVIEMSNSHASPDSNDKVEQLIEALSRLCEASDGIGDVKLRTFHALVALLLKPDVPGRVGHTTKFTASKISHDLERTRHSIAVGQINGMVVQCGQDARSKFFTLTPGTRKILGEFIEAIADIQ